MKMNRSPGSMISAVLLAVAISVVPSSVEMSFAQETNAAENGSQLEAKRLEIVGRGLEYLATKGQARDGSFSPKVGAGITSLAVTGAMRNGRSVDDPMVAKALKALEAFVKPDGGIYSGGHFKNYETCVAVLAFSEANRDGRYDEVLKKAKEFLLTLQYGNADGRPESDPWYGGSSYSGSGRPDLSNTSYLIDALRAMDTSSNDPAIQRALAFVSRCQNLESQYNDTQFAALVKDGGFYYEIPLESVDPNESTERFTPNGGIRSYGAMSYSGLKSMIYAGLTKDDPRVVAVVDWIKQNYAVDKHPGMNDAGLYYYYNTFSASLNAANLEEIVDSNGVSHAWRHDLIGALAGAQQEDGSWKNKNRRWLEDDENLATSFALLALAHCKPSAFDTTNPK